MEQNHIFKSDYDICITLYLSRLNNTKFIHARLSIFRSSSVQTVKYPERKPELKYTNVSLKKWMGMCERNTNHEGSRSERPSSPAEALQKGAKASQHEIHNHTWSFMGESLQKIISIHDLLLSLSQ